MSIQETIDRAACIVNYNLECNDADKIELSRSELLSISAALAVARNLVHAHN